ncbi:HEPN domain-containing protein [Microbacterium fluvii]|uniref:HEPN domain-containing protein n=1 Tax=Microbacterium fluvii TaxID=415215 RepID=A0ABW2HEX9_9MICO|nr:MAE_28990/MAE_18760 family HEPN-like nuclease [Microbacterium fluvii]MCU4672739.1 MAE_28990/MAE_18760 family HEPN-like nuclease [Microbacterium fluvii]
MEQDVEGAWQDAEARFATFTAFVDESHASAPEGNLDYATELYSGWVLLAYAAHESALTGLGRAAMAVLARNAPTPDALPEVMQEWHLRRTIAFANELSGVNAPRRRAGQVRLEDVVRRAYTSDWADVSILMRLDANAWPSNVREWLSRLGVSGDQLRWMKDPHGQSTDTLESRVSELVQERNDLAHGIRPTSVRSADAMREWSDAVLEFSRRVSEAIQVTLATSLKIDLKPIGVRADEELGSNTAALATVASQICVGGHVLCKGADGRVHHGRIVSIQCDGADLAEVAGGSERVAVTLNRPVEGMVLYAPI